jgi:hypothetical protein
MLRNSEIEALRKEAELANWRAEQAQNQLNTAQATAAEYADLYRDALRDGVTIDALQKRNERLARAYRKLRISYDRILNKIWFRKNKTRWRRTDNAMA